MKTLLILAACIAAYAFSGPVVSAGNWTFSRTFSSDGDTVHGEATRTRTYHRNCETITVEQHRVFTADVTLCDGDCRGIEHVERFRTVTREPSCDGSCAN